MATTVVKFQARITKFGKGLIIWVPKAVASQFKAGQEAEITVEVKA